MDDVLARWSIPIAIVAVALIVGVLADRIVVARIRAVSHSRNWLWGEALASALSGMTEFLFLILGASIAAGRLGLSPGTLAATRQVLLVGAIVAVTVVATRLTTRLTHMYTSREDAHVPSSTIIVNLTRIAIVAIGALVALSALGISITPLLTALGVGGLAVALALQETLSNLFAGLQLIGSKQIEPGDYISLETGEEGYVEDMTWRYTAIRQLANNMVIVPNSKLASSLLINYHQPADEMSVLFGVGVSYGSDLEHVERVTVRTAKEVMGRVEGCVPDFEPFIRYHTFGDSSIDFNVILRVTEYVNQYLLKHEFAKALKTAYDAEGIEIPFPQRVVHKPAEETPH